MRYSAHISACLMSTFLVLAPVARAADAPDVLARNTTNEVIQIVSQDKEIKAGNSNKIDKLVETKVLPHFDFKQMTRLAMGKNWATATPEQQARLVKEFRTLLVRTYAGAIASVSKYKISFKPFHMAANDTDVMVYSEVHEPGAAPVTLDYHMKKERDGWKVYDVLVDSASLVTAYRSSFNSSVRKGGVDGLIADLSRRNQHVGSGKHG
jgi:phospholipid transport system substrate-binding protein